MGLEEITVSQDLDIVDDQDKEWIDDSSKPEIEFANEKAAVVRTRFNEPARLGVVE